jgi:hypothetical protein
MKRAKTCDGRANSKGEDWIDLCASDSDSDVVCCSKVCSAAKEGQQKRNRNDTFNRDLALARTLQQQEDQSAYSVHGGTYKVSFPLSPCTYTFLCINYGYRSEREKSLLQVIHFSPKKGVTFSSSVAICSALPLCGHTST